MPSTVVAFFRGSETKACVHFAVFGPHLRELAWFKTPRQAQMFYHACQGLAAIQRALCVELRVLQVPRNDNDKMAPRVVVSPLHQGLLDKADQTGAMVCKGER